MKGALKTKIESNVDNILFSKKLATIATDAPVEFRPEELECRSLDADEIRRLFGELEFRTLLSRVLGSSADAPAVPALAPAPKASSAQGSLFDEFLEPSAEAVQPVAEAAGSYVVADAESLPGWVEKAEGAGVCGLSFVMTASDAMLSRLKGVAVAVLMRQLGTNTR